jgi:hypothetical protein
MSSELASEFQRLHELTKNFQIADEVIEAFGDPDRAPYCGVIVDRAERLANLQRWRAAQQDKPRPGLPPPLPPRWEAVREGPRLIYTRLSHLVDVHAGIDEAGRVAIKLFNKGEDDAASLMDVFLS